jgi:hypothetical protein
MWRPEVRAGLKGPQGREVRLVWITILLLLLGCLLTSTNWILYGKSIHNFITLGAQPGFLIKLQIDRFKDFDFSPAYWTSKVFTGLPLHAGYGMENPLLFPCVFFKRFGDAVAFYDGLVQFLGCLGMYFLLLRYGFSWTASTLCAVLLGFNAYYPSYGTDPQLGVLIYFLPWVVLIWDKFLFRARDILLRLWYCVWLALCLSVLFVASNIQQYAFIVLLVLIPYGVTKAVGESVMPCGPGKWTITIDSPEFIRILGWVAAMFGVNLLLILFELWPTLKTIQMGNRMAASQFSELLFMGGLITLAVMGIDAVICSNHRSGKYARILLIPVIFLAQWGDLGHVLANFFKGFAETGFNIFGRECSYILTPLQALAVAYGVIVAKRTNPAAVVLLSIGIVMLLIGPHTLWYHLLPSLPAIGRTPDYAAIIGLMTGLAVSVDSIKSLPRRWKCRLLLGVILAVLPLESSYLYLTKNLFTDHFKYVQEVSPEVAFLKSLQPTDRVGWINDEVNTKYHEGFLPGSLPQYMIISYFGPASFCANGWSILPRRAWEYAWKAMPTFFGLDQRGPINNLVDLAGVEYIFAKKSLQVNTQYLQLIQTTQDYRIYRNPQAFPRVFLISQIKSLPDDQIVQRLSSENLNELKKVAYLEKGGTPVTLPPRDSADPEGLGTAHIVKYDDQHIEIDCRLNQECFLVLTDTYHPDWKAYLQGRPMKIHRTDFLFRGVKLPAGHHILTFEFDAPVDRAFFVVSCTTLLLVLVTLLSLPLLRRLKKPRPPI